jgi:hypothetical protein
MVNRGACLPQSKKWLEKKWKVPHWSPSSREQARIACRSASIQYATTFYFVLTTKNYRVRIRQRKPR